MKTESFLRLGAATVLCLGWAAPIRAQNLITNGSFEANGAALHGADGTVGGGTNDITGWSVGVRGTGYYSDLTVIGSFTGVNGNNAVAGVDIADFRLSGGAAAAQSGTFHADLIGAGLLELNHKEQRLNSVLYQDISGLVVGQTYELNYYYSSTSYVAGIRTMKVRVDNVVGGAFDSVVTGGSPTATVSLGNATQTFELFPGFPPGSVPVAGNMTLAPDPQALASTRRTTTPNAVSSATEYDHVTGNGAEAPVTVNWIKGTILFAPDSSDVRINFWNDTNTFGGVTPESEYHYASAGGGSNNIWFGHEVGMILDNVSLVKFGSIPESGTALMVFVCGFAAILRRTRHPLTGD